MREIRSQLLLKLALLDRAVAIGRDSGCRLLNFEAFELPDEPDEDYFDVRTIMDGKQLARLTSNTAIDGSSGST